jgi:hypothetical protein
MDSDKEQDNIDKSNESSSASLNSEELEMFSKVEEKLKKELSQEIDNSETENKDRTLYAYCSECQENIFIQYKESIVVNSNSFPVYLVWVHGKPFHGLLVRIDKNFVSRGERVVHLEFDPELSNHYG